MEVNENPEEITTETDSYNVDWDSARSDRETDIKVDSGHQQRSRVAVKSALNRCCKEMSLTPCP